MEAKELRIGNYVSRLDLGDHSLRVESVLELRKDKVLTTGPISVICLYSETKPIPLTEEWLFKFGFSKCLPDLSKIGLGGNTSLVTYYNKDDSFRVSKISNGYILRHLKGYFIQIKEYDAPHKKNTIKYVHQFQNLFFALKGEELLINL